MTIDDIKDKILPVLEQNHIKRAGIFGSVAKGETNPNSDIDILIELSENISLLEFVHIKHKLEDLLEKKVDLVEYEALKPRLRDRILSEELRIYG